MSLPFVRLIHIFFSGPLLIWVGLAEPKFPWVYKLLLGLGVLLLFAFGVKLALAKSLNVWYVIHATLFASLLIYVGYVGRNGGQALPHIAFSLLLAVGVSALGFHLIRVIQKMF